MYHGTRLTGAVELLSGNSKVSVAKGDVGIYDVVGVEAPFILGSKNKSSKP